MTARSTDRRPGHGHGRLPEVRHAEVRVALVVAACLLVEAIVAKNVLDVQLDLFSQFGAIWVWVAYMLVGRKDRAAELTAMVAAVLTTVAILVVYAF